ncbi:MAG: hypothetical protein LW809_03485 [Vampirovibrionales bacterium]|jgi:hypothetical protein|nr:hypothetical protein [Vampirovibrionales bacterium]
MSSNISVASTTPTASGLPAKKATTKDVETATSLPQTSKAKTSATPLEPQKPATSVYAYETARQDFESAKKANPDAYKQYALNGSDLKAESVSTKNALLTRFETGTIVKESKPGEPVTVTSPNGLVIESAILNKGDVEQELAKIDQSVDALNLPNPKSEIKDITEKQLTHNLAESEIWGITMSNPDAVTINEKTEDIDVTTPSGVFHLDKQDNIHFDRADGKAKVTLAPSLKTDKVPSTEGEAKVPSTEVATKEKTVQKAAPKKLSLTA